MCLMKLKPNFEEDEDEIERLKDEVQEFLMSIRMYPSRNSKRKRRLGHYNFNELRNHEIYRNDVKLVLAICPPITKPEKTWDLNYLQKKMNERKLFRERSMQWALIKAEDMKKRNRSYNLLRKVFEEWKRTQATADGRQALRGTG